MPFLPVFFILLMVGFVFPSLIVLMAIGLFLLLPFILLAHSISVLMVAPASLWQTFTNKQVRRNHALEHATANVLEEKFQNAYVGGMAFKDGFQLYGRLPNTRELISAAQEARQRLLNGEDRLALHPRCGTSLMVGQLLFALVFLMVFVFLHHFSFFEVIALFLLSSIISRPLGLLAQKYITTSTDVGGIDILNLSMRSDGSLYFHTGKREYVSKLRPAIGWQPLISHLFSRW